MTRSELLAMVPVRAFDDRPVYIRLDDIPEPWRSEFRASLLGSNCPAEEGEAELAWVSDWRWWVAGRAWGHPGPTGLTP